PEVSAPDVTVPDVGVDVAMPSIGAEASADMPTVDAEMPSVDVPGGVGVPSVDIDAPSSSVEVPSVDLAGKMPSVEGSVGGELPSGDMSVTAPDVKVEGGDTSLTAGLAAGGAAAVGAIGAAVGLSGDKPDAEAPSVGASLTAPEIPSVDVKKPKKSKFVLKKPSFRRKGKTSTQEIPGVDASVDLPSVSGDAAVDLPTASVEAPSIDASVEVPSVT
ncbi:unnamed protein product, partial [Ectocarpus sp. 12 AP-2014]